MVKDLFGNSSVTAPDPLLERLRAVTLGIYEIRGELGRGGMAVVYLAKDIRLERTVAIKVMLPELLRTEGMAERFLLEARISARLSHHNIIVVHDVQQHGEIIYFVMSLVDGCGVDEICHAGVSLPIDEARWILLQTAQALSYANAEGIVHRDVKPANILLTSKGDVIVTDFGIAKVMTSNTRSMGATIIGTPLYMSPEQVMGQRVSEASDQYSLGVTGYTLLAGAPPFSGELSLYQLQTAHLRTRPVPLTVRRPDCPPALAAAIMRMLEKRQEDRWPSLQELVPVLGEGLSVDGRDVRRRLSTLVLALRAANVERTRVTAIETPVTPRPGTVTKPSGTGGAGMHADSRPATSRPAASVRIIAERKTLELGDAMALFAEVADERGARVDTPHVSWQSSAPHIAHVDASGTVISLAPGRVQITAIVDGSRAVLQLDVVNAPTVFLGPDAYSPDAAHSDPSPAVPVTGAQRTGRAPTGDVGARDAVSREAADVGVRDAVSRATTPVGTPNRKWVLSLAGIAGLTLLLFGWFSLRGTQSDDGSATRTDSAGSGRGAVTPGPVSDSGAGRGAVPVAQNPDSSRDTAQVTRNAGSREAVATRSGTTVTTERPRDALARAARRRDSIQAVKRDSIRQAHVRDSTRLAQASEAARASRRRDSLHTADSIAAARRAPSADDIQRAVDRFVATVVAGQNRGASLADFMNKGSEHRVRLQGTPRTAPAEGKETSVFITLALYRINPGGSPENRTVDLTLRGSGTGAAFSLRLVGTGELQRAKK